MSHYVQIGAGAGDCDPAANYRDGFSLFVKGVKLKEDDRIIVVEANKLNLNSLRLSWIDFPQVSVYQLAIGSGTVTSKDTLQLFYSLDDGPHFQISSTIKEHVQVFFAEESIRSFEVPWMDINSFLKMSCEGNRIEILATDIEGLDVRVLNELDLSLFDIHKISFEKSHGGSDLKQLVDKLKSAGYRKGGMGMDPHNSDALWVKPESLLETVQIFLINLKHVCWELQIPARHAIKTKLKSLLR